MPTAKPEILFAATSLSQANGQCDCNCDCACASYNNLPEFVPSVGHTHWKKMPGLSVIPLDLTNRIVFNPVGPVSVAVLNQPAFQILDSLESGASTSELAFSFTEIEINDIEQTLTKLFYLNLISPAEVESTSEIASAQSTKLTAWLHITDACNLRCAYCYLSHTHGEMSLETGKAAIDATIRSAHQHNYTGIKLKYAGGEPLLRYPFILELHQYALARAREMKLALEGVVLSNGTLLTEEMARGLLDINLHLMISLDGLAESHDVQRAYADGKKTSQDVLRGIEIAQHAGLNPDISITISSLNVARLAELLDWILDHNSPFSINFYRENDLSTSQAELALQDEKIIKGMRAAFKVIEAKMPSYSLLASLLDRTNLSNPHSYPCSAGRDYLVFDEKGQLSQCQMLMEKKIGDIHMIDPLAVVRQTTSGVHNIAVDEKDMCKQCQWRYWCAGGCPIAAKRVTQSFYAKSPACNIYKNLFPDILHLEGLRLLKYRNQV